MFLYLAFFVFVVFFYFVFCLSKQKANEPPVLGKFLPYLGAAIQFGKNATQFVQQCKQRYGDVFTVYMIGRKITFLTNPAHFDLFFNNSTSISFEEAVEPFTGKVFGISRSDLMNIHPKFMTLIRSELAQAKLKNDLIFQINSSYSKQFSFQFPSAAGKCADFFEMIRMIGFNTAFEIIFGVESNGLDSVGNGSWFQEFKKFEQDFEIAASPLPHSLMPSFSKAKATLLAKIEELIKNNSSANSNSDKFFDEPQGDQTLVSKIIALFPDKKQAKHILLALIWALQTNSLNVMFWTCVHILKNPEYKKRIEEELSQVVPKESQDISKEHLKDLKFLNACVNEAIRMYSPGLVVRKAIEDIKINEQYVIPKGNELAINLHSLHTDPNFYGNPLTFQPERFLDENAEHKKKRNLFIPFGGGQNLCPGRAFAMVEIPLLVALMFRKFNLNSEDPVPDYVPYKAVGVKEPISKFSISYSLK